ncbi:hypothetical protein Tco_0581470 [Tanacetum coccineum]
MTASKLPSLIGMRSISKGIFSIDVGKNKSIGQRTAKQKVKVLLSKKSRYCQSKIEEYRSYNKSFTLGSTEEADNVKILQSCNGLLLCSSSGTPVFDYVYNSSTNQYKKLPYPDCSLDNSPYYSSKWSLCSDHFNYFSFDHFDSGIYWNDGLHWLETKNRQLMHYSLNIEDPDHPIITTIPIPQRGTTFLKSYGYMDPMQILIQMSHLLNLEGKLFEWRGSLFLVCLDNFGSREFTIYEMMIGCSVWMVRYRVHTNDFMTPLPEGWLIRSNVWSIVLGEREQDSFLVIKLSGKAV